MIESFYWKKDLLEHVRLLQPIKKPPKWSEKLVVNFEKKLIISFFIIRKLFEANKVSQKSRNYKGNIFYYKSGGKKISKLNQHSIDEIYNINKEHRVQKGIFFIANQLIHSCTLFAYRKSIKDRNWDGIYVCSDFERDKNIYRITIKEIIKIFKLVGKDYPSDMHMIWNKEKNDYVIETN